MASCFYKYEQRNSKVFSDFLASYFLQRYLKLFSWILWRGVFDVNREENKGEDRVPGLDPSLGSPVTAEPNCYSVLIDLVGFRIWLYSTDSATGLVLTWAGQGVRHTGLGSESGFTTRSHCQQFHSDFSLSLSSLWCLLSAPRVQIERQLVRLVYFAICIPFANVLKMKIFLNNCFIVWFV